MDIIDVLEKLTDWIKKLPRGKSPLHKLCWGAMWMVIGPIFTIFVVFALLLLIIAAVVLCNAFL